MAGLSPSFSWYHVINNRVGYLGLFLALSRRDGLDKVTITRRTDSQ